LVCLISGIFGEKLVIVVLFCLVDGTIDRRQFFVVVSLGLRMIGVKSVTVTGMLNSCGAGISTLLLDGRIEVPDSVHIAICPRVEFINVEGVILDDGLFLNLHVVEG